MPSTNTITAQHVRELLSSSDPDPRLVLLEGHPRVVPAAEAGADRYRGAVEVVSRDDLTARIGPGAPSERDLEALASRLQTVVSELGG
ncbi:hypothetical protein ACLIYM_10225 [Streptomyces fenghuangensis]|uniref:Uncharacterized protein n=1 Tax=Streptomyces chitinivorans TaxID=1257027 RepID=A0ABW7HRE7_9ACTN|nr:MULTISPECIES: hypothetical protein [Streptomyces]MCG3043507.1 hypothetical protein [Streptomyces sp. ICN903]MDH2410995.1 hypothetical protein [Streptomyces chitinivorans]